MSKKSKKIENQAKWVLAVAAVTDEKSGRVAYGYTIWCDGVEVGTGAYPLRPGSTADQATCIGLNIAYEKAAMFKAFTQPVVIMDNTRLVELIAGDAVCRDAKLMHLIVAIKQSMDIYRAKLRWTPKSRNDRAQGLAKDMLKDIYRNDVECELRSRNLVVRETDDLGVYEVKSGEEDDWRRADILCFTCDCHDYQSREMPAYNCEHLMAVKRFASTIMI